jgi:GxxExxY protein
MRLTQKYLDELTYQILGCAIEVHRQLGPGLLESVYEKCFITELGLKGLEYQVQQKVPIHYKGLLFDTELRLDVIVENLIVTELKSIEGLLPIHESILLTYMKLTEKPKGILVNFNCTNIFKEGQKTFVNSYYAALPKI